MTAYQMIVATHIGAGVIALLTFWTAAFARKGGALHRAVGKVYLSAMVVILATAVVTAIAALAGGQLVSGVFLSYLVLITATACWLAWRAPRLKREPARFYQRGFAAVAVLNVLSGLLVFAIGLQLGNVLLMGFCWVGVFTGLGMLHRWRASERPLNWWLREHFISMLGNGVATHIAFFSIGLQRLAHKAGVAMPEYVAWFAPVVVALVVGIWLDRRYPAKHRQPRASKTVSAAVPAVS
ncbi:MAG: hypothetical protein KDI56_04070 [Xanthomonadales bacterium]|nr:hypothetical protein [Xanthomonadales bacterium]